VIEGEDLSNWKNIKQEEEPKKKEIKIETEK